MPKCNICKTIYESKQREIMISNKLYWCAFCDRVYKVFNPVNASYFSPELKPEDVLARQKERYESGKSTGWYRN